MKFILAAALAVVFACPVYSQGRNCGHTLAVEQGLALRFGETVSDDHTMVAPGASKEVRWRVWSNEQTGTWTFTGSRDGVTCIFRHGKKYSGQTVDSFFADIAT